MPKYKVDYRITPGETQIVKAFAIMAMIAHHLFYEHPEFGDAVVSVGIAGKVCVALFVFLSGYGMATSFPKNVEGRFNIAKTFLFVLCRRYEKFFLSYWFIFFISVPIGVFVFNRPLEAAYGENANLLSSFISDMLGQQSFNSYNITWWFNAIILALWLLFPFLYCAMKNFIVSIFVLLFIWINPNDILFILHTIALGLPTWLLSFALGIFVALHIDRISKFLNNINPNIVLGTSIPLALVLLFLRGVKVFPNFNQFQVDPFATALFSFAVVCICRKTKKNFSFLQFVGKHSMNMYLTHTFIVGYFFTDFIYGFKYPIIIFTVLFSISLLLSICIEFVKNKIGFYKLQNIIVASINKVGALPISKN